MKCQCGVLIGEQLARFAALEVGKDANPRSSIRLTNTYRTLGRPSAETVASAARDASNDSDAQARSNER
jgi:hypothetical protein